MTYTPREVTGEDLLAFQAAAQGVVNDYFAKYFPKNTVPQIGFTDGPKYTRYFKEDGPNNRSAYCFVEKSTGNILKADGWKRPAKGARGNIHTAQHGAEFINWHGAAYLR